MANSKDKYREAGGAVVETALMMMIFVPLMLYVMFIQDAMQHLLEIQETAIATIWDFSTAPFGINNNVSERITKTNGSGSIDQYNKWQFMDHESAFVDVNDPNTMKGHDKDNKHGYGEYYNDHHELTPFADTAWVASGTAGSGKDWNYSQYYNKTGSQVVCQKQGDKNFPIASAMGGVEAFASTHASYGGKYVCWAKGFILNKILPRNFMPEFIKTNVFSGKKYSSDAHGSATSSAESQAEQAQNGGTDLFMFFRARAAMLADSWAALSDHLDRHRDYTIGFLDAVRQDQGRDFHERVNHWFKSPVQQLFSGNSLGLGIIEVMNTIKYANIINYKARLFNASLANPFVMPMPEELWLTATYSHVGRQFSLDDYRYKPWENIFGAEHFTTSSRQYLQQARGERTEFYLGLEQE